MSSCPFPLRKHLSPFPSSSSHDSRNSSSNYPMLIDDPGYLSSFDSSFERDDQSELSGSFIVTNHVSGPSFTSIPLPSGPRYTVTITPRDKPSLWVPAHAMSHTYYLNDLFVNPLDNPSDDTSTRHKIPTIYPTMRSHPMKT